MFTIDIAALEPGLHTLDFTPKVEAVELDPELFRDLEVETRLDVSERRILLFLTAKATATLECDRTLREFEQEIEGSYSVLFAPAEFVRDDADAYYEVRVLDPADKTLDVTDVVRDTVLLSVPAKKIAPGAEDEEIQTTFGAPDLEEEDDIDPRWSALKALKQDTSKN